MMGKRMPNFSRGTDRGGYQGFFERGPWSIRAWCDGFARAHTPLIPVARAQILAKRGGCRAIGTRRSALAQKF